MKISMSVGLRVKWFRGNRGKPDTMGVEKILDKRGELA